MSDYNTQNAVNDLVKKLGNYYLARYRDLPIPKINPEKQYKGIWESSVGSNMRLLLADSPEEIKNYWNDIHIPQREEWIDRFKRLQDIRKDIAPIR